MTIEEIMKAMRGMMDGETMEENYEHAKALGYTGTFDAFKAECDKIRNDSILGKALDEKELGEVSGAGFRCAPAICHTTYNPGENCIMDDECNHFVNGYTGAHNM